MKKLLFCFILLLVCFFPNSVSALEKVNIYLFYSSTCSHCTAEKEFLNQVSEEYSNVNIRMYEVSSEDNNALFTKVKEKFNSTTPYVPFTAIGEKYYIGFNDNNATQMRRMIEFYSSQSHRDLAGEVLGFSNYDDEKPNEPIIPDKIVPKDETVVLPILGEVNPKDVSLPLVSVVLGTIDGFNPCAMWVLLFLISMLIGTKDKKKMWVLGLTFLISSAFVYFLFMMAWLEIALSLNQVVWIRSLIALVAVIGGIVNIRSYLKTRDGGCQIIDDTKRNKMFDRIRKFTSEKSFLLAVLGIVALAFSVNLVELACSAGFPLLFTQILSLSNLSQVQYLLYILLYVLFFLLDDIIVFVIAMKTLKVTGITTKYSRYSHLIGGILMVGIGILLLLKPEWLMFNFL